MDTQPEAEHLFWNAFLDLPLWQKAAFVAGSVVAAPFLILTAVSLFPFFLFGRWEGDMGKAPMIRDVKHVARVMHANSERYYAPT